jgi:NAD(P)-dependent dehydrogenase (short-subunit alcohol dehydrogenase family)
VLERTDAIDQVIRRGVELDVTSNESVWRAVEYILASANRIDVVVNNRGRERHGPAGGLTHPAI